ncbi:MAG TPA: nuclear transport factor 2 family protein [Solirubrobacterales bacterium]|nr:nuclear transport factor 2 family protein [Solirubrobacterales bacterium]
MSQELIEQVLLGHEGFNRGDLSQAKANVTDDVEWGTTGTWPGLEDVYRGPEALDEWMQILHAEWETFEVSLDEVIRDDGEVVVLAERLSGRGKESGIEVEMQVFSVYWSEEGKIVRRRSFRTREEALAAL